MTDNVILLHGLARTNRSMSKLAHVLEGVGYHVINQGYPSTQLTIQQLAEKAIPEALSLCNSRGKIHFVTHSMGGILVRQYLSKTAIDHLGRVVMLGPPNNGSEVVDRLRNVPGFRQFNGAAGMQLGTDAQSVPNTLGAAQFDVGIIAGRWTINWILSTMLPNPNDGKVSVESTKLEGMKAHLVLPVTHPLMMNNSVVIDQVLHFLRKGEFSMEIAS